MANHIRRVNTLTRLPSSALISRNKRSNSPIRSIVFPFNYIRKCTDSCICINSSCFDNVAITVTEIDSICLNKFRINSHIISHNCSCSYSLISRFPYIEPIPVLLGIFRHISSDCFVFIYFDFRMLRVINIECDSVLYCLFFLCVAIFKGSRRSVCCKCIYSINTGCRIIAFITGIQGFLYKNSCICRISDFQVVGLNAYIVIEIFTIQLPFFEFISLIRNCSHRENALV